MHVPVMPGMIQALALLRLELVLMYSETSL